MIGGVLVCLALGLSGCSGGPEPRATVMSLFTGLHANDTTRIRQSVDLERAWSSVREDLAQPGDSLSTSIPWGERLFASLTGEGNLRKRWMKTQVVLNKTELFGDSATVEVSFIYRESGMHYYNKMGLIRKTGRWVIVAFRTM
jgi:hypothetical protein